MKLQLTNARSRPCLLRGFPGVSLTSGPTGAPIGASAARVNGEAISGVLLASGQTGSAVLRYTNAGNYPDCTSTTSSGYRIYPPEDTGSIFLPRPTKACSNSNIKLLAIGPFQPG